MVPKVAVIWINYNSSHIINIVKESLRSLFEANYPRKRYEVIVVDNASKENSWKTIRELTERYSKKYNVRAVFYRSSRNLMYTGGNEIGLRLIRKDVKFVGFINNDVIIDPDSISRLVEYLSTYKYVGAAQGILYYDRRGKYVNSAGCFVDTLFNSHMISTSINKPISVSYTYGAYSIYSLHAIKRCLHKGKLFFQCVPAFFDDNYLGLRLWNLGYISCALPINAGLHLHGATFKRFRLLREVNLLKSIIVAGHVISDRSHLLRKMYIIRKLIKYARTVNLGVVLLTYIEALKCGKYIVESLGSKLSLKRMPHIPLTLSETIKIVMGAERSVYNKFVNGEYILRRACLKDLCPK